MLGSAFCGRFVLFCTYFYNTQLRLVCERESKFLRADSINVNEMLPEIKGYNI